MIVLLAVDPGLIHPAAALFRDGVLLGASRVRVPRDLAKLEVADRCATIGDLILVLAALGAIGGVPAIAGTWIGLSSSYVAAIGIARWRLRNGS